MNEHLKHNRGWASVSGRAGGAVLGSAAALILAWMLVQSAGGDAETKTWDGAEFTLVSGKGWRSGGAYHLAGGSNDGEFWLLASPPIEVAAADYSYLRYRIEGLDHGGQAALLWPWADGTPGQNQVPLPWNAGGEHLFRLDAMAEWRGEFTRFAILVSGPMARSVTVQEVALEPATSGRAIAAAWAQWTALEGWSQRSINFVTGAGGRGNLHLLPVVAAFVALAALLYLGLGRLAGRTPQWRGIAVIFFLGWLAMDLLWQRQLLYRLDETRQRYEGKSPIERLLAAPDGGLFWFMRQVKARLPDSPSVIHLLTGDSDDSHRYIRYRSQYHLRPHNFNVNTQVPTLQDSRPGEYILVVGSHSRVHFAEDDQALVWPGKFSIPAKSMFDSPNGALYAVTP